LLAVETIQANSLEEHLVQAGDYGASWQDQIARFQYDNTKTCKAWLPKSLFIHYQWLESYSGRTQ